MGGFYFEVHHRTLRVLTRAVLTIRRKASSEPLCSWTDTSGPEPAWDQLSSWRWGRGERTGEASRDQTSGASRGAHRCVSASPSKRVRGSSGPAWRRRPGSSTTWRTRRPPTWSGSACPRSASPWPTSSRCWTDLTPNSSSSPWMMTSGESRDWRLHQEDDTDPDGFIEHQRSRVPAGGGDSVTRSVINNHDNKRRSW